MLLYNAASIWEIAGRNARPEPLPVWLSIDIKLRPVDPPQVVDGAYVESPAPDID